MDLLALMRTFVRIADAGSISGAARTLRLSVAMASRHLAALERELGTTLMRRSTRRLDLTDEGVELLARARRLLREVEETRDAVRQTKDARGLVVISAPVSFGLAQLAPLVPRLLERQRRLSLEMRYDDRVVDLLGEGVDLAIRTGVAPPDSPFLVARKLASFERLLCAAPAFLRKHGPIEAVETLGRIPALILGAAPARWQLETPDGPRTATVDGRLRSNNVLALREAALAGLGVAQLPRWLVVDDLAAQRLVPILDGVSPPPVTVIGLIHSDARRSNALRVIQDFLAAELPAALGSPAPARARPAPRGSARPTR